MPPKRQKSKPTKFSYASLHGDEAAQYFEKHLRAMAVQYAGWRLTGATRRQLPVEKSFELWCSMKLRQSAFTTFREYRRYTADLFAIVSDLLGLDSLNAALAVAAAEMPTTPVELVTETPITPTGSDA